MSKADRAIELTMALVALVWSVPLYLLINLALKSPADQSASMTPVTAPTTANLDRAWGEGALGPALLNSLVVTLASVILLVAIGSMAAYPLARITRRWARWLEVTFMLGLIVPLQLGLMPLYTAFRDLELLGTLASLIIFNVGKLMPLAVFLYVQFLRAIPVDYEQAAVVDGAGRWQAFRFIVFPLLRPATSVVVVLTSISIWNDFFAPLLFLSGGGNETAPVALYGFVGQFNTPWNTIFAGVTLTVFPVLLAYFVMQRRVIEGFSAGLKG